MSSTTVALSSAGGSASACSPLSRRPTCAISTALNASTMWKKSLVFPSPSASTTSINSNSMMIVSHLPLGSNCYLTTTPASNMIKGRRISCEVALSSSDSATSSTTVAEGGPEMKIGAKVRVKVPLKVYHVPRVPELDLAGKEGHVKQYAALWKEKRISANLPYKVEFVVDIEGRGPVKFFAHLKEDEFEYLD